MIGGRIKGQYFRFGRRQGATYDRGHKYAFVPAEIAAKHKKEGGALDDYKRGIIIALSRRYGGNFEQLVQKLNELEFCTLEQALEVLKEAEKSA